MLESSWAKGTFHNRVLSLIAVHAVLEGFRAAFACLVQSNCHVVMKAVGKRMQRGICIYLFKPVVGDGLLTAHSCNSREKKLAEIKALTFF